MSVVDSTDAARSVVDSTDAASTKQARRGSKLSDDQIAYAVRDGKLVRVVVDGHLVEGWVCGADDYHWAIVTKDEDTWLVHKSASVQITRDTDMPENIARRVAPYREHLLVAHFRQKPKDSTS